MLFLAFLPYRAAFTLSFALGIVVAYLLNCLFVFGVTFSWHRLFQYPLIYALQYGLASILLTFEVERMRLDARLAPLINVPLLLPLTFMLNKWFLTRKKRPRN